MEHIHLDQNFVNSVSRRSASRMPIQADLEAGLLPPMVPILDADLLDDDFEADGVNDFMRGLERDDFDDF